MCIRDSANDVRANDQIDAVACAWVTEEGVDMVVAQGREELGLSLIHI